jgi:hypothetical protein
MKTLLIIQLAALAGAGYYLFRSSDEEATKLKDDENFKKGFAVGWVTPGPVTLLVIGTSVLHYLG